MNISLFSFLTKQQVKNITTLFWTVKFTTGPTHFSIFHMNVKYNLVLKCIDWCRMYIFKHWLFCNCNLTRNQRHLSDWIQSQQNAWKTGELSKLKGLVFLDSNRLMTALVSCNKMVKLIPTDWCSNTCFIIIIIIINIIIPKLL